MDRTASGNKQACFRSPRQPRGNFAWLGIEGKYAFGDGVDVLAGRGYLNYLRTNNLRLHAGYEMGIVRFNYDSLQGNGREYGVFLGMEARINRNMGITLDMTPTYFEVNAQNVGFQEMDWGANGRFISICFNVDPVH